jgi:hypothetical protein
LNIRSLQLLNSNSWTVGQKLVQLNDFYTTVQRTHFISIIYFLVLHWNTICIVHFKTAESIETYWTKETIIDSTKKMRFLKEKIQEPPLNCEQSGRIKDIRSSNVSMVLLIWTVKWLLTHLRLKKQQVFPFFVVCELKDDWIVPHLGSLEIFYTSKPEILVFNTLFIK